MKNEPAISSRLEAQSGTEVHGHSRPTAMFAGHSEAEGQFGLSSAPDQPRLLRVVTIIDLLPITIIDGSRGLHTAKVPVASSLWS